MRENEQTMSDKRADKRDRAIALAAVLKDASTGPYDPRFTAAELLIELAGAGTAGADTKGARVCGAFYMTSTKCRDCPTPRNCTLLRDAELGTAASAGRHSIPLQPVEQRAMREALKASTTPVSSRADLPYAVRAAVTSADLYQVLMDVQNGIDSPGLKSLANGAIMKIDKARAELAAIAATAPTDALIKKEKA